MRFCVQLPLKRGATTPSSINRLKTRTEQNRRSLHLEPVTFGIAPVGLKKKTKKLCRFNDDTLLTSLQGRGPCFETPLYMRTRLSGNMQKVRNVCDCINVALVVSHSVFVFCGCEVQCLIMDDCLCVCRVLVVRQNAKHVDAFVNKSRTHAPRITCRACAATRVCHDPSF